MKYRTHFFVKLLVLLGLVSLLTAFSSYPLVTQPAVETARPQQQGQNVITITFLHTNDIYEIIPVSGGKLGGAARLATLKKQLLADNPNTYLTLGGDLYAPSGMSTAVVDGERLDGLQAVEVMNVAGLDYMVFGDHEIDEVTSEANFLRNLAATDFTMISSNVFSSNGQPFSAGDTTVKVNEIFTVTQDGKSVRVGLFGPIKPIGRAPVPYTETNIYDAAAAQVAELKDKVDILVGLTHLPIEDDLEIASRHPEIDLILGGDEHQWSKTITNNIPIYKADSNARSAYVVNLTYDLTTKQITMTDYLQEITDAITEDVATKAVVDEWTQKAFDGFRAEGIEPTEVVVTTPVDLDGFASSVRNYPTELTKRIVRGMHSAFPGADAVLHVSALIRLDDLLPAGSEVTMYDIIRGFPNDPNLLSTQVTGEQLKGLLDDGLSQKGQGGFVQTSENITLSSSRQNSWLINGQPIDDAATYDIVTTQIGYDYMFRRYAEKPTPQVSDTTLRQAFIQQLKSEFGLKNIYLPVIIAQ